MLILKPITTISELRQFAGRGVRNFHDIAKVWIAVTQGHKLDGVNPAKCEDILGKTAVLQAVNDRIKNTVCDELHGKTFTISDIERTRTAVQILCNDAVELYCGNGAALTQEAKAAFTTVHETFKTKNESVMGYLGTGSSAVRF